jgi:hypothetical protein
MKTVEEIIKASLEKLLKIGSENALRKEQESKLIFPQYSVNEKKRRVSEQEARFIFIREIEQNYEGYYSVETPTILPYRFSIKGEKLEHPQIMSQFCTYKGDENGGRSGEIDVCLYDNNGKRVHLIEFKSDLASPFEMEKDFLRLKYEPFECEATNYFVHIKEKHENQTIKTLIERYKNVFNLKVADKKKENKVKVFVCFLSDNSIIEFDEDTYTNELKSKLK